jgi:hypothetical protein
LLDARQGLHKTVWSEYGDGLQGFEKRYGAMLADRDASSFFATFLFPTLFHENPRYSRLGPGTSVWRRAVYAISRTAIARNDAGGATPNLSLLFTIVAAQSLKNAYYPEHNVDLHRLCNVHKGNYWETCKTILSREFVPDIERFLWKPHAGWIEEAGATHTVPTNVDVALTDLQREFHQARAHPKYLVPQPKASSIPFVPASTASSIPCSPLNMCWRCFAARKQRALLALASTGSPTVSPKSSQKRANYAQPETGQRLAG